jgi:hypothetical protein
MPLADDRDPASRQLVDPSNPGVRNPYGAAEWNQGGTILGRNMTGGVNAYGVGSVDYSGQAQQAYDRAARTLRDVRQAQVTNLAPGQSPVRRSVMMDAFNNFKPATRPVMAAIKPPTSIAPPPAAQQPSPAAKMALFRKVLEQMDSER